MWIMPPVMMDVRMILLNYAKQPPEVFYEKGVLTNFTKFTGKHLCQSLFFNSSMFLIKLHVFIKKETLAQVFSCEFYEICKNTFFTEHLWTTASESSTGDDVKHLDNLLVSSKSASVYDQI